MSRHASIGILTFHRCINYGSYWQARCLAEGLNRLGHWAELLDHQCSWVDRREWRCALNPLLPERGRSRDYRLYAAKARRFRRAFERLPLSKPIGLDGHGAGHYGLVIVGSDEVWNLHHPWYGGKGIFYGDGLNAERVISFAASFGNYSCHWGIDEAWAERLKRFDRLSVRDENSYWLVKGCTGVKPELVLDPVLQFPDVGRQEALSPSEPYLLLYGHGFPDWYAREVRAAADRHRLRLVSIGYRNGFADEQWIGAGPLEFARAVAGASAVATNFFHGCVFALLAGKPFAAVSMPYRHNKLRDLTGALAAQHHLVSEDAGRGTVAELLRAPLIDPIHESIARLRSRSTAYLDAAVAA